MNYSEFVDRVQRYGNLDSEDMAIHTIRSTLEVLAERLAGGEAQDLFAQLPREITGSLRPLDTTELADFGLSEFIGRVSEREGTDRDTAAQHARAVVLALRDAVSWGELQDVFAQLPNEFGALLDAGQANRLNMRELG